MNAKAFIDTNIFLYSLDKTATAAKRRVASELIRDGLKRRRSVISYQVVQEFLNAATKKFAKSMTVAEGRDYLDDVLRPLLGVQPSFELFHEALRIHTHHQLSWYDSLIVAAATEAGCSVLYTEDLQHGAKFEGVRVENPFRAN
jgi:predicted nucleic acid-binding protein